MAAFDRIHGPWPINLKRLVDAMGQGIPDAIFVETECGLVVQVIRDEYGDILVDERGDVRTKSSTRPAPITLECHNRD